MRWVDYSKYWIDVGRVGQEPIVKKLKEENIMEVKGNYNVAMVNFLTGSNTSKKYAFALFDNEIVVGDFVLCDTSYGYQVTQVVEIIPYNEYSGINVSREVICKIDFTKFNRRKELRKQKESLKKQMDKMVADNQDLILYQAIADKNQDMAVLLEAYKALGNV